MNFSAGSRQTSVASTAALLFALAAMLLAFVPVLQAPAHAVQACDNAEEGCAGNTDNECFGLEYLNKFEFDDTTGGGAFEEGDTTENTVGDENDYSFTGTTAAGSVTVTYTVVEDGNGKFETHSVTWSSTIGIDRVWLKAGGDTDEGVTYNEATGGTETLNPEDNAFSHITFCYDIEDPSEDPSVELTHECVEGTSKITVTITNPDDVEFSYDVVVGDDTLHTFEAAGEETIDGELGEVLKVMDGDDVIAEKAFEDCTEGEDPNPTVELSAACDGTQPTATVTIDNDGDEDFGVTVTNGDEVVTIDKTTTFDGDALSTLRVEWGEDESDEIQLAECIEPAFLDSTASFTVGSECQSKLPALTYDATISETADDPVGNVTLTVSDSSGELGTATFSESDAGAMLLPTVLEGETVTASWDFDGTTQEQTLASGCADVLGANDERDEDELPATEVKGEQIGSEQLPNTGAEHVILLVLGSALIALGGFFLRVSDRRQTVLA